MKKITFCLIALFCLSSCQKEQGEEKVPETNEASTGLTRYVSWDDFDDWINSHPEDTRPNDGAPPGHDPNELTNPDIPVGSGEWKQASLFSSPPVKYQGQPFALELKTPYNVTWEIDTQNAGNKSLRIIEGDFQSKKPVLVYSGFGTLQMKAIIGQREDCYYSLPILRSESWVAGPTLATTRTIVNLRARHTPGDYTYNWIISGASYASPNGQSTISLSRDTDGAVYITCRVTSAHDSSIVLDYYTGVMFYTGTPNDDDVIFPPNLED